MTWYFLPHSIFLFFFTFNELSNAFLFQILGGSTFCHPFFAALTHLRGNSQSMNASLIKASFLIFTGRHIHSWELFATSQSQSSAVTEQLHWSIQQVIFVQRHHWSLAFSLPIPLHLVCWRQDNKKTHYTLVWIQRISQV